MRNPITLLFIGLIKFYRYFISPMLGQKCKYYPSCSSYGLEAMQTHGAIKGLGLTIWRILRCNPFSDGGYDPVPPSHANKHTCSKQDHKKNGEDDEH